VLDKGALGTKLWDHLAKRKLPRYQWTFLEGRTRLRFLSWSHGITLTNGLCFMGLVMLWLRGHGIEGEVAWQTDWGEEFGGTNLQKLQRTPGEALRASGGEAGADPVGEKGARAAGWNAPTARTTRSSTCRFWARCTQKRGC